MKLINHGYVCPVTLKSYGPICLYFKWDIFVDDPWDWMARAYPGDSGPRLQLITERMIRLAPMRAYFDTKDDAMLFKLTFGGL